MTDASTRSRRAFLGGIGQVAAGILGGGRVAGASPRSPEPEVDPVAPPPTAAPLHACAVHDDVAGAADLAVLGFLGPVALGTAVGAWTIARLHAVFRGALPLVLAHPDGRRAQVDLMATDAASPPGIAATRAGQLYLVNSGRGTAPTPPDLERAIQLLAARLADRDGTALALLSFAERHRCHPDGVFVVPA